MSFLIKQLSKTNHNIVTFKLYWTNNIDCLQNMYTKWELWILEFPFSLNFSNFFLVYTKENT